MQIKLAGTVIEGDHSRAILVSSDGKTQLRSVGESIEGFTLRSVEVDSVVLEQNGRSVTLREDRITR